jgi:hypothetical protein
MALSTLPGADAFLSEVAHTSDPDVHTWRGRIGNRGACEEAGHGAGADHHAEESEADHPRGGELHGAGLFVGCDGVPDGGAGGIESRAGDGASGERGARGGLRRAEDLVMMAGSRIAMLRNVMNGVSNDWNRLTRLVAEAVLELDDQLQQEKNRARGLESSLAEQNLRRALADMGAVVLTDRGRVGGDLAPESIERIVALARALR